MRRETCEERSDNKLDGDDTAMQSEEMRWNTYHGNKYENKQVDKSAMQCENLMRKETDKKRSYSIGSSKSYSDSLR